MAATHHGDPWYGSSRAALMEGLAAAEAAARPIHGGRSIWETVLHMTAWTREVERRLRGGVPDEPEGGDWPRVGRVTAARWKAACTELDQAHASLLAAMDAMPPSHWSERVGSARERTLGTGVTHGAMLIGLAQHDAYHLGQIALLRRALPSGER
jgi:uncharacterized damage-inducible protein DinB